MKTIKIMQGDVIAHTVDKLPEGAVRTENKPVALGEIHGHAHVVTGDGDKLPAWGGTASYGCSCGCGFAVAF